MSTSYRTDIMSKSTAGRQRRYRNKKHRSTLKHKKVSALVAYGKIYADWCGYCVALKPEWAKVEKMMMPVRATNIESSNKDHHIDQFNTKYKTNLPKQVGFPTIFKLSKYGGPIEIYKGDRKAESIVHWLRGYRSTFYPNKDVIVNHKQTQKKNIFNWF